MLRKFERKAFCRVKKNMVLRSLSQHPDKVLAKSILKSLAMGIYFSIPKQQLFSLLENYIFFYDRKYQQRWKTFVFVKITLVQIQKYRKNIEIEFRDFWDLQKTKTNLKMQCLSLLNFLKISCLRKSDGPDEDRQLKAAFLWPGHKTLVMSTGWIFNPDQP